MEENENLKSNVTQENTEVQTETQETPEQINWKKFRQQREEDSKRAHEAEERAKKAAEDAQAFKAALDAVLNKPEETEDQDDDKIIEKKMEEYLRRREENTRKEQQEREKKDLPGKLKSTYQDFDKVCTQENLDYMEFHYPEIAKAFLHMPDGFDKWSNVYHAVKKLLPNTNMEKEKKKIEQNLSKPQSINTGLSQTGDTTPRMTLDEKRKAENWLRMRKAMKGV